MLHFRPSNLCLPAAPIWPAVDTSGLSTVFSERAPLRKLIVMIDAEVANKASDELDDELGLLVGLLSHPFIVLARYADDGPPADAPRQTTPLGESVPGWVIPGPPYEDGFTYPVVRAETGGVNQAAFLGDHIRAAEGDHTNLTYADLTPEQAAERRRLDAIAVRAAFAAGADLFIANRAYFHAVTWNLTSGVLVARPEDALGLVALYLRTQGVFDTYRSRDGHAVSSVNRGLFYWIGTRALLPAGWRWFAACHQYAAGDSDLVYLAQSPFTRVQRALEARDLIHRALNQPQHNDTAELALASLDVVLLMLMGALDATARIAHRALDLPAKAEPCAGWQRTDWLKRVARQDASLAESLAANTWNGAVVRPLAKLRNAVHAAAPAPLGIGTPGRGRHATMVGFPHTDADEIAAYMDCLGGRERWSFRSVVPGRRHADPGTLLEQLFPAVIKVLDTTMAGTPVEHLAGVKLQPEHCHPPADHSLAQWQRTSIVRQLALGPTPRDTGFVQT